METRKEKWNKTKGVVFSLNYRDKLYHECILLVDPDIGATIKDLNADNETDFIVCWENKHIESLEYQVKQRVTETDKLIEIILEKGHVDFKEITVNLGYNFACPFS